MSSDTFDRELSRSERWALRLHLFVCGGCRQFKRQLNLMRTLLSESPVSVNRAMSEQLPHLSADRRERIKQLLREATQTESG